MNIQHDPLIGTEINGLKIISSLYKTMGIKCVRRRAYYICLCVCGNEFSARADHIKNNKIKSCGCISAQLTVAAHILPDNQAMINQLYRHCSNAAKKRKISFQLSIDEFKNIIFNDCFYCGTKPRFIEHKLYSGIIKQINCSGVDRLNSDLEYSHDNCVPCCPQCNFAKSNYTLEKFKQYIKQLICYQTSRQDIPFEYSLSQIIKHDPTINRLYSNYYKNAKNRKISFNLSKEDFIKYIFENCFYCGAIPRDVYFKYTKITNIFMPYNGIDRLDSNLGYINENCVTCCISCNRAKSDLTLNDFQKWIDQLVKFNIERQSS